VTLENISSATHTHQNRSFGESRILAFIRVCDHLYGMLMVSFTRLTLLSKIPYDKAAIPVKRIDAFRIDDPGQRAVLFDQYKLMRHCPKS
jgi:hypothetical protein